MIKVFSFKREMDGDIYYLKHIPLIINGKVSLGPIFSYPFYCKSDMSFQYVHYSCFIINGEFKLCKYGQRIKEYLTIYPDTITLKNNNVIKVKVSNKQGFISLNCDVISLNDWEIPCYDKYIVNTKDKYQNLIKDIDINQIYEVALKDMVKTLSSSKDDNVVKVLKKYIYDVNIKLRLSKINRIKKNIINKL